MNHDCHDESGLVATGMMLKGVPVKVNRIYAEADFSIAVGNIVPHMNAGWRAGPR